MHAPIDFTTVRVAIVICQLHLYYLILLPEHIRYYDHVFFPLQLEFGPVKLKAKKHKLPKVKLKGYSSSSSSSSSSSDSSSDSD